MSVEQPPKHRYALDASALSMELGGRTVLAVPSLQVSSREALVIIGPNGSGKSTLLLCLALLLKPTAGAISYYGTPVTDKASALRLRRRLAVVFQAPLLLDTTVWNNVMLGLRLRGIKGQEANTRVQRWLDCFNIGSLAGRQARTLSGGEAQRASLARAFVVEPEVLFLDEPFSALDAPTRQTLINDVQHVLHETKVTTVMVTHDRNEARALADRVAVLIDGRIRQLARPQEVFAAPADEVVANFVGMENMLPGATVAQHEGIASVAVEGWRLDAVSNIDVGGKVTVCLRPEDITLSLPTPHATASIAGNHLLGKLVATSWLGSQVRVTVDCGFPLVALITLHAYEDMGLTIGTEVMASFKASSVHLIAKT